MTTSRPPGLARLEGALRHDAWGSHTSMARLEGRGWPTPRPESERWFGAHPARPSVLDPAGLRQPLDAAIAAAPEHHLGDGWARTPGEALTLPFLLKLLAVASPLSLQVHPDAQAAARGCAMEDAAGLPRDDAERRFRDPWPKPELLLAVTPVRAFCGVLPPAAVAARLERLGSPDTAWLASAVADGEQGVRAAVGRLLTGDPTVTGRAIAATVARCRGELAEAGEHPDADRAGSTIAAAGWIERLAARWPNDPAVLVALLLGYVELAPGEALYVPPGTLHAYLHGIGVEVMRTSDNVLRAGWTPKHVDPGAVVAHLDPQPGRQHRVRPVDGRAEPLQLTPAARSGGQVRTLVVGDPALRIAVLPPGGGRTVSETGPRLLLALGGGANIRSRDAEVALAPAEVAYVPAGSGGVEVSGTGSVLAVSSDVLLGPPPRGTV